MQRHLVLLGASNLTRTFPHLVSLANHGFEETLSVFAAKGFGRSYGREAGCLGKNFPGIFFSGIWRGLERANSAPISAMITDVGNDLGYEVPVETLLEWVSGCIDRLQQLGAEIVMTDVPVESIRDTSAAKFRLFRSLLFPACRLSRQELMERVEQLQTGLLQLAESRNITVFSVRNYWRGFDPIHPDKRHLVSMWRDLVSNFEGYQAGGTPLKNSLLAGAYLRLLQAEKWSQFSFQRQALQPNGQLQNGTSIFLY